MELKATQTVGEVAAGYPASTRLFDKLGIDYCCGGGQTLSNACKAAGLNYDTVAKSLAELVESAPTPGRDWTKSSLSDLIEHIVTKHHEYIRSKSPRLQALAERWCGCTAEDIRVFTRWKRFSLMQPTNSRCMR